MAKTPSPQHASTNNGRKRSRRIAKKRSPMAGKLKCPMCAHEAERDMFMARANVNLRFASEVFRFDDL